MAVEKRLTSPLMVSTSVEKLFEIDSHVGCAVSGLTADAKMLVEHARVEAQVSPASIFYCLVNYLSFFICAFSTILLSTMKS